MICIYLEKKEQRTRTRQSEPTSKDHKYRVSYRASSNSNHSRPIYRLEKPQRQTRPYVKPKQTQIQHRPQPIITQNMFVFSETESEDENEINEPTSQTPQIMLKQSAETKIYNVEHIEGLKLLGFISTYSLSKEACLILDTYTENCKLIHQQYMEYDKRKRPYKRNYKKRKNPHHKKRQSEITAEDFSIIRDFKKNKN